MRILDPVLVPDVSIWVNHINAVEFAQAGCPSVVVGLYSVMQNWTKILSPVSLKQCQDTVDAGLVLQAYYWDDIINDPLSQADWVVQTIKSERLPVKWVWADQEQWWTDWTAYNNWRRNPTQYPLSTVPKATPANISLHNAAFVDRLNKQFPASGVYTNNGFVASWAAPMNTWLPKYKSWVPQYGKQSASAKQMSWEQLKENWLPDYDIALASGQPPEQVEGHQFTGDVFILPGSYDQYGKPMALDVSEFEKVFIDSIKAGNIPPTPAPTPQPSTYPQYVTLYMVNVRSTPYGPAQSEKDNLIGTLAKDTLVYIDTLVPGGYSHMQPIAGFPNGGFIATQYLRKV